MKTPVVDSASQALALVPLDAAQARLAELPEGRTALILGEAGHGKTTVAIHRLMHLSRRAVGRDRRWRAAVVVPGEGIRGLIERALVRLGVDVPVVTFERFARAQARRAFPDVPRRESHDATPATMRLKRDPALAVALTELAARAPGLIDDDEDAPVVATASLAVRGDLQHLFGDRTLLEHVVAASRGRIPGHAVTEVLEHTRVQFGATGERAHGHVDKERLLTSDRRSLDHGTPDADASTVDTEDYSVLFELDRLRAISRATRATRPRAYECLVLDEAQELAPIELALLGRSLARNGTLVVAGDADQQLDERACFRGWEATMRSLGATDYERTVLDVSYRCPPDVVALARHVLSAEDPFASDAIERFANEDARNAHLLTYLGSVTRDAGTSVAVIVRSPLLARRLASVLRAELSVRLVWGGDFRLAPGVDLTTVDQVRGLEFDHVVVPDASPTTYGDDPAGRRALYVAITRARRSLRLLAIAGPASPSSHR